jgi:hypothetical protein
MIAVDLHGVAQKAPHSAHLLIGQEVSAGPEAFWIAVIQYVLYFTSIDRLESKSVFSSCRDGYGLDPRTLCLRSDPHPCRLH